MEFAREQFGFVASLCDADLALDGRQQDVVTGLGYGAREGETAFCHWITWDC